MNEDGQTYFPIGGAGSPEDLERYKEAEDSLRAELEALKEREYEVARKAFEQKAAQDFDFGEREPLAEDE